MANTLAIHVTTFMRSQAAIGAYGPKSQRVVGPRLRAFSDHFGRRPLSQLTRRAVEAWLSDLDHLAPASRAAYLGSVRKFCAWLTMEQVVMVDPCAAIPTIRRAQPVPRAQSRDDVRAILAAAHCPRDRAIVWLMVGLGLRRMEVAGLRWEDYDERAMLVTVRVAKNGRERVLPVTDEVAKALRPLRARSSGPIVRSFRGGDGITPEQVGRIVSTIMREAGVKSHAYDGVSGHALRHTCASDVLDECNDLRVVQQMLGHSQLSTTAIYLRRASADSIRAAMGGRDYGEVA